MVGTEERQRVKALVKLNGLTKIVDDPDATVERICFARNGLARHLTVLRSSPQRNRDAEEATRVYLEAAAERVAEFAPEDSPVGSRRLLRQDMAMTDEVAEYLAANGVNAKRAELYAFAWSETTARQAVDAEAAGLPASTAIAYAALGVKTFADAMLLHKAGVAQSNVGRSDLSAYMKAGWQSVTDIVALAEAGITPDEAALYSAHQITDIATVTSIRTAIGPLPPADSEEREQWVKAFGQKARR